MRSHIKLSNEDYLLFYLSQLLPCRWLPVLSLSFLKSGGLHTVTTLITYGYTNIFIRMLKDVGTAVPKIREARSVARQGIMAYNKNTMRNSIVMEELRMALYLYAIISCLAA